MVIVALAGLALAIGLIAYNGMHAIGQSLLAVGWGILALTAYHFLPMLCSALAWQRLLKAQWFAPCWVFLRARWIREHVAHLLPVAQVGGEVVGARMLALHGLDPALATASVVVDLTLEAVTQIVFTLMGIGVLATQARTQGLLVWLTLGAGIGAAMVGSFFWVQRQGLFAWLETRLKNITKRGGVWSSLGQLDGLHDHIQSLYAHRYQVAVAGTWHLTCWVLGTGETWLALYFMGHTVSVMDALFLESLGEAIRGAAFIVPGQLGLQEGGYMLLGEAIGLAPSVGLTLSLLKRVRILLIGLPALASWQYIESKTLLARHRDS